VNTRRIEAGATTVTAPEGGDGGAPPRERLSRRRILECALAMIDRDGLEALTMRRLAAELDVSAMSLYNHVPNKEALLGGVTELLMGEIDLSSVEAEANWVDALKAGFRSFRQSLLAHPNAVSLIESKPMVTPASLRPTEVSLSVLRRAGFDAEGAMKAHWLLVGFTIGHVNFQCAGPCDDPAMAEAGWLELRRALPVSEFPHLLEALPYATHDLEHGFEFGIEVIIAGLQETLRAARRG
jgi:AcrR family transcriptional regulator